MTVILSNTRGLIDAASALRSHTLGAITATTADAAVKIVRRGPPWLDGIVLMGPSGEVVFNITELNIGGGASLTLTARVDSVATLDNDPLALISFAPVKVGEYRFYLDPARLLKLNAARGGNGLWIATTAVISGTVSVCYGAFLGLG